MFPILCMTCFDRGVTVDRSGCTRPCPSCLGLSCLGRDEYDAPGVLDEQVKRDRKGNVPPSPRKAAKPKYRV